MASEQSLSWLIFQDVDGAESQSVPTQFDKKYPYFGRFTATGANRERKGIIDQRVKLACVMIGEPIAQQLQQNGTSLTLFEAAVLSPRPCSIGTPQAKVDRLRGKGKVLIGGKQGEIMAATEMDQQCINRADLHTPSPAGIAHLCSFHVVVSVGLHTSQHRKVMQQHLAVFWTRKAL
jgi:hypothetical protein